MFEQIRLRLEQAAAKLEEIPEIRKERLKLLSNFLQTKVDQQEPLELVFVCTHNSRRSVFAQIAAAVAAKYYGIANLETFSAGTVATAVHVNTIEALRSFGFEIEMQDQSTNPNYLVAYSDEVALTCFSKTLDHDSLPKSGFAAVMTCADAELNCPFIEGAAYRIGLTYEDPKIADHTAMQNLVYQERFNEILMECLFVCSQIQQKQ